MIRFAHFRPFPIFLNLAKHKIVYLTHHFPFIYLDYFNIFLWDLIYIQHYLSILLFIYYFKNVFCHLDFLLIEVLFFQKKIFFSIFLISFSVTTINYGLPFIPLFFIIINDYFVELMILFQVVKNLAIKSLKFSLIY